jgi:hypothetical protein
MEDERERSELQISSQRGETDPKEPKPDPNVREDDIEKVAL